MNGFRSCAGNAAGRIRKLEDVLAPRDERTLRMTTTNSDARRIAPQRNT
jgi:hypothetical protein